MAQTPGPAGEGFTLVAAKKKQKGPQTIKPVYNPNDQRVIIQIHPDTPPARKFQATWRYLQLANRVVGEYRKGLECCFIRCHATQNSLVLQTSFRTRGSDYTPYLDAIKTAFIDPC